MTGYGRARETRSGRDITVEVRSVNNRYLDCTVKMPRAYIFAEDAVKARVQKAVSRGKVDVFITIDTSAADEAVVKLNRPLAQGYYKALCEINEACGLESEITASTIARFPDVLTVTKAEEDLECVAADLCAVLDDALAAYNRMRATEGERLAADIGEPARYHRAHHRHGRGALAADRCGVPRAPDRRRCEEVPAIDHHRRGPHSHRGRHLCR